MSIDLADYPTLAQVNFPDDLRNLKQSSLAKLCDELRSYLLNSVSSSSGHLASGLGVVELTVALHFVYQTPFDHLIWDVGHQAYPHKILTGRRHRLATIRQKGGLHPFPWRPESDFDVLSVGHSSTSISASLGLAEGARRENLGRKVVSVIGDGAITAGMAFEALNHAGDLRPDLLIILNDNQMSISENVGALSNYLARVLSSPLYSGLREESKKLLSGLPPIRGLLKQTESCLKSMVAPTTPFGALGFNYIGPVDGHNLPDLLATLKNMRRLKGPQLLHVVTKKGKGYAPAEHDPVGYHAVAKFDLTLREQTVKKQAGPTYSQIFGDWLCEVAAQDSRLVGITPAMCEGSGMVRFAREFSERYFDVAIAEQHAVAFAVGLAIAGYKPVVAIYSTFLQRAYDQVIHDAALQNLPILLAIDRAGVVGADGPTHQGAFDLSYLRCIPNIIIMAPSDENECRRLLCTAYHHNGPSAVRYPRGHGPGATLQPLAPLPLGRGRVVHSGQNLALLNFGALLAEVLEAGTRINATVVDMRFVKPLDHELILQLAQQHDFIVTIEENAVIGGAGSGVTQLLQEEHCLTSTLNLGLPDNFIPCGSQREILVDLELDASGIIRQIERWLAKRESKSKDGARLRLLSI